LSLTEPREIKLFEQCTGRNYDQFSRRAVHRLIVLCGRRGGKDRFESAVAVWRAALCTDWRKYISAGEQAVVLLIGADKKQASILRRYCYGLLQSPMLAREITRYTGDVVEFKNGSTLEIVTNDPRLILVAARYACSDLNAATGAPTNTTQPPTKKSLAPRCRRWRCVLTPDC
jgi:hypothetical protein